jgi:hypothetical protein
MSEILTKAHESQMIGIQMQIGNMTITMERLENWAKLFCPIYDAANEHWQKLFEYENKLASLNNELAEMVQYSKSNKKPKLSSLVIDLIDNDNGSDDDQKLPANTSTEDMNSNTRF